MDTIYLEHLRQLAYEREMRDEQRLLSLEILALELNFNDDED